MTTIAPAADLPLDAAFWPALARRALGWLADQRLSARDAVVLVPFAELLPLARRAFAQQGGWQPRVETTQTLVGALMPPNLAGAGHVSVDATTDRLAAAALLCGQPGGAAWARGDARGFEHVADAVAQTARELADAAAAVAPPAREAWWDAARAQLPPLQGPGSGERVLARVALEWAAQADAVASDVLFALRPSAWIVVQAGGPDALTTALAARGPTLLIDADADLETAAAAPRRLVCADFEAEAQATAAAVLEALAAGQRPVGLIAHDRLLVRRTRALLERAGVQLADETGWKLSTTRAGARVMALLRAAAPTATPDERLDWLKSDATGPEDAAALRRLEAAWRRGSPPDERAAAFWSRASARLAPWASVRRQPLQAWLTLLRDTLQQGAPLESTKGRSRVDSTPLHVGPRPRNTASAPRGGVQLSSERPGDSCSGGLPRSGGSEGAIEHDPAHQQLLAELRLDGVARGAAWDAVAHATPFDLEAFTAWVDDTLEKAPFKPPADDDADVVITPPARALLRPFAGLVFPGADDQRLPAATAPHPLLPDAVQRALGLADARARREFERLALAHLLRLPAVTLLRRASDGNEALAASPLVERAEIDARRRGTAWPPEAAPQPPLREVAVQPLARPLPVVADVLPQRFSASTVEALRACPYRFYARSVLRLHESPELDTDLEKRDYGSWLHAVLLHFHRTRPAPGPAAEELQRLHAAADAVQAELQLDAAQLLPYRAGFATLAPHYIAWLHAHDAAGWTFAEGEVALTREPPALAGVALEGRIDRIDRGRGGTQLIDYKTVNADTLRRKVAEPLEDTQLAFYAALLGDAAAPLHAAYLALEERKPPQQVEHAQVQRSAGLLVEGLGHDLAQMRAGAPLQALGEGPVCETCEARGLCRRDHWAR